MDLVQKVLSTNFDLPLSYLVGQYFKYRKKPEKYRENNWVYEKNVELEKGLENGENIISLAKN